MIGRLKIPSGSTRRIHLMSRLSCSRRLFVFKNPIIRLYSVLGKSLKISLTMTSKSTSFIEEYRDDTLKPKSASLLKIVLLLTPRILAISVAENDKSNRYSICFFVISNFGLPRVPVTLENGSKTQVSPFFLNVFSYLFNSNRSFLHCQEQVHMYHE